MFKKLLLGLLILKATAVLGTFFGKWILAIPVGAFFLYILYQKGLKWAENPPPPSEDKEPRWKLSDSDAYIISGEWGYGD